MHRIGSTAARAQLPRLHAGAYDPVTGGTHAAHSQVIGLVTSSAVWVGCAALRYWPLKVVVPTWWALVSFTLKHGTAVAFRSAHNVFALLLLVGLTGVLVAVHRLAGDARKRIRELLAGEGEGGPLLAASA